MPIYNMKVGEKNFKIEVSKIAEDAFTVKVNNKTFEVKLKKNSELKNVFSIILNGQEYKIEAPKVSRREPFTIKVDDVDFKVQLQPPERKIAHAAEAALPAAAAIATAAKAKVEVVEGAVTAPMTGKIVSVRVKEGEEVKQGQVLCILEAMKMENEITAPKSGKVKEVRVSEGTAVNEGDILLVIG